MKCRALLAYGFTLTESKAYGLAQEIFAEALDLCSQLDELALEVEAHAGLGRVALASEDLKSARRHAETILENIGRENPITSNLSLLNHLTCIQILSELGDSRAMQVLEDAYHLLCERQDNFQDLAARQGFIQAVPWHLEIVRLWENHLQTTSQHP